MLAIGNLVLLVRGRGGLAFEGMDDGRQGYGYACIRGLAEGLKVPDTDVVILTEGDGTFFADDVVKFLAYVDHSDLVVGNRVVRGLVDSDSQMDYFFTWGNMAVAMLVRLRFWDGRHLGPLRCRIEPAT